MPRSVLERAVIAAGLALTIVATPGGCGAGGFGAELTARPEPRDLKNADGEKLSLPADEAFTIRLPKATKEAALGGTANADASAERTGAAAASADVSNGGSAAGTFQLGHAVRNATNRQIELQVAVSLAYEFETKADPPSPLPDSSVSLKIFAIDQRSRVLHDLDVALHSSDRGLAASKSSQELSFFVTLGPGDSINIYAAGQAAVGVKEGHSAASVLKLSGLKMDLLTKPAPPVRTAADGPK
ncbi:hypothetical protein RAS1_30520 [Phycisphaerae bacterium RAS1]|nr:hypothetical protein RAS1_30520 [Phycisphaerae bacterium RAS1]